MAHLPGHGAAEQLQPLQALKTPAPATQEAPNLIHRAGHLHMANLKQANDHTQPHKKLP
jgi:hypothetical protein